MTSLHNLHKINFRSCSEYIHVVTFVVEPKAVILNQQKQNK